jgi:Cdc6-like AAA superfamily ATPase
LGNPNYNIPHEQLMSLLIRKLSDAFANSGGNKNDYGLPKIDVQCAFVDENRLINDEIDPGPLMLLMHVDSLVTQLNADQRTVYDTIIGRVYSNSPGFFFVYGHGGTGKTFLWNTIIARLRSEKKIVLVVASSGVASLLLPKGRTAHSRFKIPFDVDDASTCNVNRGTMLAELIQVSSLIIWDEAPMMHRWCFEALDKTMCDILSEHTPSNALLPFGGKPVVLGGDF